MVDDTVAGAEKLQLPEAEQLVLASEAPTCQETLALLQSVVETAHSEYEELRLVLDEPIRHEDRLRGWSQSKRDLRAEDTMLQLEGRTSRELSGRAQIASIEVYTGNVGKADKLMARVGAEDALDYHLALLRTGHRDSLRSILESLAGKSTDATESTFLELAGLKNLMAIHTMSHNIAPIHRYRVVKQCLIAGLPSAAMEVIDQTTREKAQVQLSRRQRIDLEWISTYNLLPFLANRPMLDASETLSVGIVLKAIGASMHAAAELVESQEVYESERNGLRKDWYSRAAQVDEAVESLGYSLNPEEVSFIDRSRATRDLKYYASTLNLGANLLPNLVAVYFAIDRPSEDDTVLTLKYAASGGDFLLATSLVDKLADPLLRLENRAYIIKQAYEQNYQLGEAVQADNRKARSLALGRKMLEAPMAHREYDSTPDDELIAGVTGLIEVARLDVSSDLAKARAMSEGIANPEFRAKIQALIRDREQELLARPQI